MVGQKEMGEEQVVGRLKLETLQERVYGELRSAFLRSRFLPGQHLTLRGLAELTGTSVQPVREALQRLSAEGAVEWLANRAVRVPEIEAERYRELWEIRKLLEGEATKRAATRVGPNELDLLRRINSRMRQAMQRGDGSATLEYNRDFHFAVYRGADSPILVSFIEMVWMQISPLFAAFTHELATGSASAGKLPAAAEDFFALQDALVAALENKEAGAAVAAIHHSLSLSAQLFSAFRN